MLADCDSSIISIHALRVESDEIFYVHIGIFFISIHALRVESDKVGLSSGFSIFYFNPRSPCGERRLGDCIACLTCAISIHALRVESDSNRRGYSRDTMTFQSTLSVWRATTHIIVVSHIALAISIHALRVESDSVRGNEGRTLPHFNPRSPCGERPTYQDYLEQTTEISIHALRVESDLTL